MHWIDWCIVAVPMVVVIGIAFYARRYVRGVVDYIAAGRVAGRFVMNVAHMASVLSVIWLVAGTEQYYQTGFGIGFWNNIIMPFGTVLALTGFCAYRWRETRCLSRGQFLELRYGSKSFRIITATISTLAEMITNAIGPAIAANFFIFYLGLPHEVMICGVNLPCYVIVVTLCLLLALVIIWPAGQISLLVTDCLQGLFSYPIFILIVGFIILKFSWNIDILPVLCDRVPEESFLNPYDVSHFRDFNLFAIVVTITSQFLNYGSWIGDGSSSAGRTPHEQKMAGVLVSLRLGLSGVLIMAIALLTVAFMNGHSFAGENRFHVTNNEIRRQLSVRALQSAVSDRNRLAKAVEVARNVPDQVQNHGVSAPLSQSDNLDTRHMAPIKTALGDTPEGRFEFQQYRSLYSQMMMPLTLRNLLPVGLAGLFALLMLMLLISTDDSRIFSSVSSLVQDVFLPFFKERLSPRKHLLLLRSTAVGVTIFFLAVGLLFRQLDYINMFTTIMCALWIGGAGPIMLGGLYTRFGNLTGAWCAIIFGSGTSLLGLVFQQNWAMSIYPFLERHDWVVSIDFWLRRLSAPFMPWIDWKMDAVKFPINSYEIFFISMMLSVIGYVAGSLLTYKPYNLDRLLHRGQYSDGESMLKNERWSWSNLWGKLIGITSEYTLGDKLTAWFVFFYSFVWQVGIAFVTVLIFNAFHPMSTTWWGDYLWVVTLAVPGAVSVFTTVWFFIGGILDLRRLFVDLGKRVEEPEDNGQVRL